MYDTDDSSDKAVTGRIPIKYSAYIYSNISYCNYSF